MRAWLVRLSAAIRLAREFASGTHRSVPTIVDRRTWMTVRSFVAMLAVSTIAASAAHAQAEAPPRRHLFAAGNVGYAWDKPHGGLTVNAGAALASRTLFAYVMPLDFTFVQGKQNFRYVQQTTYTGETLCIDKQTGNYTSNSRCRAPLRVHYGGAVEANYAPMTTNNSFFIGGGYRTGYARTGYGTIGYIARATTRSFGLARLSIGSGFAQLAIGGHL
jgi:hypothetical protein